MMPVLLVDSPAAFNAAAGDSLCLLHFRADWAVQCAQMSAVVDELAKDPGNSGVVFVNVEAERVPEVSQRFRIVAVPTFVLVKAGVELARVDGADPVKLAAALERAKAGEKKGETSGELEKRMRLMINSSPVMLFMKGSPDQPRCGFSRQMVELLQLNCIGGCFGHFDILTDSAVREGLKKLSNWPTFPQLYANGELLGGLDVVKEMAEAGELQPLLKEATSKYLDGIIRRRPTMLFMKGSPEQPRCGFSRQMVELLNSNSIEFGHFDILGDQFVRQALKSYSNWPTFPQLYANGELLGGLDVVKEMAEAGELKGALAAK